jgi:isochorismate synthase
VACRFFQVRNKNMDIVFTDNVDTFVTPSLWSVHFDRALLLATLYRASTRAALTGHTMIASFTQPVGPCDPLTIFRVFSQQGLGECFFWEKPEDQRAFVGIGTATTIETTGVDSLNDATLSCRSLQRNAVVGFAPGKLPTHVTGPILFGGFAFDPLRPTTSLWDGFPDGLLILPRVLFSGGEKNAALTVNLKVEATDDIEQLADEITVTILRLHTMVERLLIQVQPVTPRSSQLVVRDLLPAATWKSLVASAVQHIQQGAYQKVVLARAVEVTSEDAFAVDVLLQRLREGYSSAYVFAIQRGLRYFVGATPERLVFAQDGQIRTMALAGSAPRGATEQEDRRSGMELLNSEKNRREHAIVVNTVRSALEHLCSTVQVADTPHLLKLQNIQHLETPITGELLPGHSILEALHDLHPTPAVGGFPRDAALAEIRDHERLDRGWYAGPIGWIDKDGHGEFAVALRSGLIDGNKATLFAGCGIVDDSDPDNEYAESRLKLKVMLRAL